MLTTDDNFSTYARMLRAALMPAGYQCWYTAWGTVCALADSDAAFLSASYVEGWIVGISGEAVGELAEHGWIEWQGGLIELSPVLDGTRWAYFPGLIYSVDQARQLDGIPTAPYAAHGAPAYRAAKHAAWHYAVQTFPQQAHREGTRQQRRQLDRERAQKRRAWLACVSTSQ